tara:strand:- start:2064 stop:3755 length:1692 start_codon:yes stop_codon:yes gene_type:complete
MSNCDVQITSNYGWTCFDQKWGSVWIKGYVFGCKQLQDFADTLVELIENANEEDLKQYLSDIDGHFSVVIKTPEILFASVDRIRSIPLFFTSHSEHIIVTDQPAKIGHKLSNSETSPGLDNRLMLQMSGYCSGNATLLDGVKQLQSGEYLKFKKGKKLKVCSYYNYLPSNPDSAIGKDKLKQDLEVISIHILQKIIDSAQGRMIVVPLSGGYDSRLVASGFAYLGYKNVKCFSYGQNNNFESSISRKVSEKLGYDWKFIKLTHDIVNKDYHSELHKDYFSFSNTFASVPVEHEFTAVRLLKESGWIPDDAIFVNGMSGDFLTGSHLPEILLGDRGGLSITERKEQILKSILDKHYSLWRYLETFDNLNLVADNLWKEILKQTGGLAEKNSNDDFGLYEFSEFKNRQTKYVITVQRVYEFFGYEWRLPLWDKEYLDYWEIIEAKHKVERNLFVEVMHELDWGGVWSLKHPSPYIVPKWISIVRLIVKGLFAFIGRDKWKIFDKTVFYYWTEILCKMGVVSYSKVIIDNRGYRNAVSWMAEDYLNRLHKEDNVKKSKAIKQDKSY